MRASSIAIWIARIVLLVLIITLFLPLFTRAVNIIEEGRALSDLDFRLQRLVRTEAKFQNEETILSDRQIAVSQDAVFFFGAENADLTIYQNYVTQIFQTETSQLISIRSNLIESDFGLNKYQANVSWRGSEATFHAILHEIVSSDIIIEIERLTVQRRRGFGGDITVTASLTTLHMNESAP